MYVQNALIRFPTYIQETISFHREQDEGKTGSQRRE